MDKKTWLLLAGLLTTSSQACATPRQEEGAKREASTQLNLHYPPQEIPETSPHYVFRNDGYARIGGFYDPELGNSLNLERLRPAEKGGDKTYQESIAQQVHDSPAFRSYFDAAQQLLPDSLRINLPPITEWKYGLAVSEPLSNETTPLEQGVRSFYDTLVNNAFDPQVKQIYESRGDSSARENALRNDLDYVVITSKPVDESQYRLVALSFRVPGI
ncbi:hypothetical protein HYW21_07335 [Candidatus Woesearchaeota archaeon]|nr:hypothetical protein [Candidatus Woesearchaeota archaeon]